MNRWSNSARVKAGTAALFLLITGGVLGVMLDRTLLRTTEASATALTADALAAHLELSPADEAHMRSLLDSLHIEILRAAEHGPDALHSAARSAHARLEAALPSESRSAFHAWMGEHNRQMMHRMHRDH